MQELGYNYRMTDIQAALGRSQIKRLDKIIEERRKIFNRYQEQIDTRYAKMNQIPNECKSSHHLAMLLLKETGRQLNIYEKLKESGIAAQIHYIPIHLQPYYRIKGFKEGMFPCAEEYAEKEISLPIYPGLKRREQDKVIKVVNEVLRNE